jgi:hypothetical protein
MRVRISVSCLVAFLVACSAIPVVTVVPSGSGVSAPAKDAGCSLPVLRAMPADRPFDELASLHYTTEGLFTSGDPAAAQDAIRAKACALGADAVIVTREFVPGAPGTDGRAPTMAGLAIRFRSAAAPAPASSPATP